MDLSSSSAAASHLRTTSSATLDPSKGLKAWEGVRFLSERDRDEIDFGVKVALRGSVDRVRELEGLEKGKTFIDLLNYTLLIFRLYQLDWHWK